MKIVEISKDHRDPKDPVEKSFIIEDISADDIHDPTVHLMRLVRELKGLNYVNSYTVHAFVAQLRENLKTD